MTREEAIYELKNAAWLGTHDERNKTEEAVEMAIKALSQEPCTDAVSREAVLDGLRGCICDEWVKTLFATMVKQLPSVNPQPCDDAVSREDAIQAVNNTLAEYIPYFRNDQIGIPLKCARALNDLPSVTQKSGKWGASCTCSVCGQWRILESEKNDGKYKFCPNCGAKMESEDKE